MKHKFKVGDIVKIIKSGSGYNSDAVGCEVQILELGGYGDFETIGYKTTIPSKGSSNAQTGEYNYMAGESSFEFVRYGEPQYEVY